MFLQSLFFFFFFLNQLKSNARLFLFYLFSFDSEFGFLLFKWLMIFYWTLSEATFSFLKTYLFFCVYMYMWASTCHSTMWGPEDNVRVSDLSFHQLGPGD